MLVINKTHNLIFDIVILLFASLIFYYGIITLGFTSFTTNILIDLVENWKLSPIIEIIDGQGACPQNYEPLLNDKWPGTVKGCDCPYSVKKGGCSSKSITCTTFSAIDSITLNIWDGIELCAKRHEKNYLYFMKQNSRLGCPLGMKLCGKLDSLGKSYCVNQSDNCFINQLIIDIIDNGIDSIKLGRGKYLTMMRSDQTVGDLVINIKASQGKVCINPKELNTQGNVYPAMDNSEFSYYCTNKLESTFFDNRYQLVDTCSLKDYYDYNKLTPVLQSLPQYNLPTNGENVELFTRGYLGWKDSCILDQYLSPENIIWSSSRIVKLNKFQYIIYIISIIYLPFMIILFFCKIVFITCNKDNNIAYHSLLIIDGINFAYVLIASLICFFTLKIGDSLINLFLEVKDSNCGDEITNQALTTLGTQLHLNIGYNKTSMILEIITLLIIPLNLIFMKIRNPNSDQILDEEDNCIELPNLNAM